jgi:uncharacterized protein (DUF433 family)
MSAEATPDRQVAHPYVESYPNVHGGRSVIKGTRFPVSSIVQNHRRGLSVDEILREFPHLTPAQVHDALSYYYDQPAQIERELAELSDEQTAMHQFPPTLTPSQ